MSPLAVAISLSRGYPTWFFFLLLFLCLALVAYFYFNNARQLPRWYFNILLALRVLIVVVLLLFIFEPKLVFQRLVARRPYMLVLVDSSQSMGGPDYTVPESMGARTRLEVAKMTVQGDHVLRTLGGQFEVDLYRFGATATRVDADELEDLEAGDEGTDLTTALRAAYHSYKSDHLAGFIVLTDGIDTTGLADPGAKLGAKGIKKIRALGVPVHCVAFGAQTPEQREEIKNVAIAKVEYDSFIAKNNVTELTVFVDAERLGNQSARIVLRPRDKEDSRTLAFREVVLDTLDGPQAAVLRFTPRKTGRLELEAAVEPLSDEKNIRDNAKPVIFNVTDPRIKVLYIEGVLRPEGKWLMRALQSDPNIELLYLVNVNNRKTSPTPRFLQRGNLEGITLKAIPSKTETWKKFNVIILGDVDRSLFSDDQLNALKEAVYDGRGLLLLGGVSALGPGKYQGTPIGRSLCPVQLGPPTIGQENEPFSWQLTPEGEGHPIFTDIANFFPTRKRPAKPAMAKLAGCTRVGAPKPEVATVLAVHPTAKDGVDKRVLLPIVAVMLAGNGRSMVVTADTTHRWYLPYRALGRDNPYLKFWGQAIRWLASEEAKRDDKPGITAYTDKGEYGPKEDVELLAYVRDSRGQVNRDATAEVSIVLPTKSRKVIQLPRVPGKIGEHRTTFSPGGAGEYSATFVARLNDKKLGEHTVEFLVRAPPVEMAKPDPDKNDEKLLKEIASHSGGSYQTWLGLKQLVKSLNAKQSLRNEPVKLPLHHSVGFLLLFIAIAASEWYMRKRIQLA